MPMQNHHRELVERAKRYPFGCPDQSFIFAKGRVWKLHDFDVNSELGAAQVNICGELQTLRETVEQFDIDLTSLEAPRKAVLASGSNSSPIRLKEKFGTLENSALIPVVRYKVEDYVPVFSAKFSSYGSITATLQYAPSVPSEIFVTFLTENELSRMHETEAIGDEYDFVEIRDIRIWNNGRRCALGPVYAYLSTHGVFQVDNVQFSILETNSPGFQKKSQNQMQLVAWELLGCQDTLDTFIYQNVTDEKLRRDRNSILQAYSTPFKDDNISVVNGPVELLF